VAHEQQEFQDPLGAEEVAQLGPEFVVNIAGPAQGVGQGRSGGQAGLKTAKRS
jgi:hypothetical protein